MEIKQAIETIASVAFSELVGQLDCSANVATESCQELELDLQSHTSIMITIATAQFRLSVLLHLPSLENKHNRLIQCVGIDSERDVQRQYSDYMAELSNNLGGTSARILRTAGHPTGLSQPDRLSRPYGQQDLESTKSNHLYHLVAKVDQDFLIGTTFLLYINHNIDNPPQLELNEIEECVDSTGELEFF